MEVIVLAGGLGTRLRSVVHEIPKCMAPVNGRPFLAYLLDWLVGQSVDHVVFSVGYLKEQVIDYVEGRPWPFSYDFAVEETPLGTGGGIRLALSQCRENKVFVVNGDTFYPVELASMPSAKAITLALKPMKNFDRYGSVVVSSGPAAEGNYFSQGFAKNQFPSTIAMPTRVDALQITAFHEKQYCDEGLINGGVYLIDRSRLDLSSLPEKFSFEKDVLEPGAAIREVGACVSSAWFIDIGIPEDYERAQWALPAWQAVRQASAAVMKVDAETLFLDRDGVLNKLIPGDYVRNWSMWEWMPGVLAEFPKWSAKFRHIILVTNQRGVGKGLMTDADLSRIHAQMMQDILEAGGRIDLVLSCTAVDKEDPRRKPQTGMFQEACGLFPDIEAKSSVMLGDAPSDAAFAANCGMQFILLSPEAVS
jgi:D-glycero-alpha-D-manno-heptose 1-phosphate guanylyltransferase